MSGVGTSQRRLDGREKVTGATQYVGDLRLFGALYGRLVLSPHASARVVATDAAAALAVPGVVGVFVGEDMKRLAAPGARVGIATGRVLYAGEPVALVVAETEAIAQDAALLVELEYEVLTPVASIAAATAADAPTVLSAGEGEKDDSAAHGATIAGGTAASGHPNITTETNLSQGDVVAALAASAFRVAGRWSAPAVHQAPMEGFACIARWEPAGELTLWTSTQAPFAIRDQVAASLGVPPGRVRVVSQPVGGGFGLKTIAEYDTIAALAARATGRPVRLVLDRSEVFLVAMALGCDVEIDVGCDVDGNLTGATFDLWFDNGAKNGASSRGAAPLLLGAYRLPAYRFHGRDVASNKPPAVAYRAPSAVAFYHLESALDRLAQVAGIDPLELRARNATRTGDPGPLGPWPSIGLVDCLEAARSHPLLQEPCGPDEAVGVAAGLWTGVGGPGFAGCLVEPDGRLTVQVGYADISGADTSMAAIAADVLGLRPEDVSVEVADTRAQPYSGQAGGSRTVYVIGAAVRAAATEVREQLVRLAADQLEAAPEDLVFENGSIMVRGVPGREVTIAELVRSGAQLFSPHQQGPIYGVGRVTIGDTAPMTTVHLARVRVDRETGAWAVTGYAVVQDVGRAINPAEIAGQVHGGLLQSAGRAFGEEMRFDDDGTPRSTSFIDYALPSIDQAPPVDVVLIEIPSDTGPLGARGVGEPPAIAAAPAIANAVRRATGLDLCDLPLEWERIALSGD